MWWDIFPRFDWDEFEIRHLERLLDLGARLDVTNSSGQTPLDALTAYVAELANPQAAGRLDGTVGALVIEWDYPEDDGVFQYQVLAEDYEDVDTAAEDYQSYRGTTELRLAEDHFLSAPRIESQASFQRIIEAVCASAAFSTLRRHPVFFAVHQEHDSCVELVARWPGIGSSIT